MSINVGPDIINDSLVLYLDTANTDSYPGTGTSWLDISNNNYTATITSSSFSNSELIYNGSSTFGTIPSTGFFTTSNNFRPAAGYFWSVSVWFKFPVTPTTTRVGNASYALCGLSGGIATGATFTLFVGSGTDTTYGAYAPYKCAVVILGAVTVISPSSVNTNTWNNVVITWDGTASRAYFNGEDRGALNIGAAAVQSGYVFGVGQVGITSHVISTLHAFEGSLSTIQVYNKGLTASEVLQNYTTLRSRYGI